MDILEKLDFCLLQEVVKSSTINANDVDKESDDAPHIQYSFECKETIYVFIADEIDPGNWLVEFEDENGNTVVLNSFGAATHLLWSYIVYCLKEFVKRHKPKSFYFNGGTNSHDLIYDSPNTKKLIQNETGYRPLDTFLNKNKELAFTYVK